MVYPYLWLWQHAKGIKHSKDRTCCIAFVLNRPNGRDGLVIVPISDSPGADASSTVEVPTKERKSAGLDTFRRAFVHIDEYNFDELQQSPHYNPAQVPLGQFSEPFTVVIIEAIRKRLRAQLLTQIDRTRD